MLISLRFLQIFHLRIVSFKNCITLMIIPLQYEMDNFKHDKNVDKINFINFSFLFQEQSSLLTHKYLFIF
jgi:hypothetical protein